MRKFDSYRDLTGQSREVDCNYHGTNNDLYLEAGVRQEKDDRLTIQLGFSEDELPEHRYDPARQSLDVLVRPYQGIRTMVLVLTDFEVPKDIKELNLYDFGQGLPK